MNSTKGFTDCIFWTSGHINPLNYDSSSFFYVSRVVVAINCISSPVSAVGNGLVFLTIMTTTSLQNPSNGLIASLALSDFLIGLIVQPLFTAIVTRKSLFISCNFEDGTTFMGFLCTSISATLMAAVSCERYMALFLHLRYNTLVTSKRVIIAVLLIWIYWITDTSAFFLGGIAFILGQVFCTTAWLLSSFAISLSYFKIFGLVRHHRHQIHSQQVSAGDAKASSQTKIAITMGYVIWASLLCYMPTTIVFQWFMFTKNPNSALFNAFYMTMTIQFMSSSFNPVIYCWRRRDIRLATVSMLKSTFGLKQNNTLNPTGYSTNTDRETKETLRVASAQTPSTSRLCMTSLVNRVC